MLDKKYEHLNIEGNIYDFWLKNNFFEANRYHLKPYTIVIPPPNVTGVLHIGHALDNTLQDIIVRQKRMKGYNALYLPGMDHAGIATQAKVDQKLVNEGTNRFILGREKFLKEAWDFTYKHQSIIRSQWKALGLSLDYTRERFTLDDKLNEAVNQVFIKLFNEGFIYRDYKIINFDVKAKTALSNIEVIHKEQNSKLYYIKYKFEGSNEYITVATTRPETCFADQALMVNPEDNRYKKYIGRNVVIPTTNFIIPIISDSYVDKKFGTGVVKVTPAHDPNDFEVSKRHNLKTPLCMNEDGTMNEMAGKYVNQERFECRKKLIFDLEKLGQIEKIVDHKNAIGFSERTETMVEPRLSLQWFVKMDKLSEIALESKTKFYPKRFRKVYERWMTDTLDWCISRQLWWGHRIPAWYNKKGDMKVQKECPGEGYTQDTDVLDTWFSSALWPFSTLGWPEETEDFKRFYPTTTLVTGYDIIFFWVSRMIFQGLKFTKKDPFENVLIHGIIRAEDGKKMSKSLGNGVDPLDVCHKYGADSLRYFITTNSSPGFDFRFSYTKIEAAWNLINKLWNISRFILINNPEKIEYHNFKLLNTTDKWIISRLSEVIKKVDKLYDKFEFAELSKYLYNFIWDDFSSWYVEVSKIFLQDDKYKENTRKILLYVLENILKLMHPFIPFVTEKIFLEFSFEKTIMLSDWPKSKKINKQAITLFNNLIELVTKVRNYRAENDIKDKLEFIISGYNEEIFELFNENINVLNKLLNAENIKFENKHFDTKNYTVFNFVNFNLYIKQQQENVGLKIELLENELKRLTSELKRSEGMLNNSNFLSKADPKKIEIEKEKYENYKKQFEEVKKSLNEFRK